MISIQWKYGSGTLEHMNLIFPLTEPSVHQLTLQPSFLRQLLLHQLTIWHVPDFQEVAEVAGNVSITLLSRQLKKAVQVQHCISISFLRISFFVSSWGIAKSQPRHFQRMIRNSRWDVCNTSWGNPHTIALFHLHVFVTRAIISTAIYFTRRVKIRQCSWQEMSLQWTQRSVPPSVDVPAGDSTRENRTLI